MTDIPIIGAVTQGDMLFNDWWKAIGHKMGLKDKTSAKAAFTAGIVCCETIIANIIAQDRPVSYMLNQPLNMDMPNINSRGKDNGK